MCSHVSFCGSVGNPKKTRGRPISSPLRVAQICKTSVTTTTRSKWCQTSEVVVLMISKWPLNINHHMSFHLSGLLFYPAQRRKQQLHFCSNSPTKLKCHINCCFVFFCSSGIITLIRQRVSRGLCWDNNEPFWTQRVKCAFMMKTCRNAWDRIRSFSAMWTQN